MVLIFQATERLFITSFSVCHFSMSSIQKSYSSLHGRVAKFEILQQQKDQKKDCGVPILADDNSSFGKRVDHCGYFANIPFFLLPKVTTLKWKCLYNQFSHSISWDSLGINSNFLDQLILASLCPLGQWDRVGGHHGREAFFFFSKHRKRNLECSTYNLLGEKIK